MYKIKTKRLERASFSSIVTWLDDGYYQPGTETARSVTLACMIYDEPVRNQLAIAGGNAEIVISKMVDEFRKDHEDVIANLLQVTTLEDLREMLQIIETFIRVHVVKNEITLLKDQH